MKIGVFYVVSATAAAAIANEGNFPWLDRLAELTGHEFEIAQADRLSQYDLVLDFIGGGGTEGIFLQHLEQLPKPCYLLTTGANNSLAASMEILSYLKQQKIHGEIIHGSDDYVASRIKAIASVARAKKRLAGMKVARVGKPSDWLIASLVDADACREKNGIEIIDIPMEEFLAEVKVRAYEENEYTKLIREKQYDAKEVDEAFYIYGALRRLVDKYSLDGLTVRCFDLLDTVHSTGCSALAILNAEGIYASCEGDLPALFSMILLGELTGEAVFMANPSRIDVENNEIVFAHCTLPISMPESFEIMTHFESQIGVAFRGRIAEGPVTVFKTNGMIDAFFASDGELKRNLTEHNLCRTQIELKLEESVRYFLTDSIGNHHLIVRGHHSDLLREYFKG